MRHSWRNRRQLAWKEGGKAPRAEKEQGDGVKLSYIALSFVLHCPKLGKNSATLTQLTEVLSIAGKEMQSFFY